MVKMQRKRKPKSREKGVKNACGEEVGLSIGIKFKLFKIFKYLKPYIIIIIYFILFFNHFFLQ